MTTTLGFYSTQVLTGNPEITDCKAFEGRVDMTANLDVELLDVPEGTQTYDGKKVAAAVGPIACDLCKHNCDNGYVLVTTDNIGLFKQYDDDSIQREVISLGTYAIEPKTIARSEPSEENQPTAKQQPHRGSQDYVPWDLRIAGEIADTAIDVHQAAVLTVDVSGDISVHKDGFQDELDLVGGQAQDTVSAREQSPKIDTSGQYRLF